MASVSYKFELDQKVSVETIGFTGIVTMCAIQGEGEKIYYIQGAASSGWYPEKLVKEVV
jgi:hypothetical protein